MLYIGEPLGDGAVRLTTPVVEDVRRAETGEGDWARWLEAAHAEDGIVYFSIERDGTLVGEIFLHDIVKNRAEGMIGYRIFRSADRGAGIGRTALALLVDWVRTNTDLTRLFVITWEDSWASRRLVEGAGFSHLGPAREDPHRAVYELWPHR